MARVRARKDNGRSQGVCFFASANVKPVVGGSQGCGPRYRIHEIQFSNGQVLSLKVANFAIRKDRITFAVTCDAFKKDIPTRIGFYSGGVEESRKDYIERAGAYGHFTQAYWLNPESEKNWPAITSGPVPESLEKFFEGTNDSLIRR